MLIYLSLMVAKEKGSIIIISRVCVCGKRERERKKKENSVAVNSSGCLFVFYFITVINLSGVFSICFKYIYICVFFMSGARVFLFLLYLLLLFFNSYLIEDAKAVFNHEGHKFVSLSHCVHVHVVRVR